MAGVQVPDDPTVSKWCQELLSGTALRLGASAAAGRGLIAARPIPDRDVLWTERPLVFHQLHANSLDVLVCRHCLRPLKTLGHQLLYMAEAADSDGDDGDEDMGEAPEDEDRRAAELNAALPFLAPGETLLSGCVECDGCGETFCSEGCGVEAATTYHRATCGAAESDVDAFMQHALEHDEVFLAVRHLIERVITGVLADSSTDAAVSFAAHLQPFLGFCFIPWHEHPGGEGTPDHRFQVLTANARKLRRCFKNPVPPPCEALFAPQLYSRLAGTLSLNCVGISFPSPQQQYWDLVRSRGLPISDALAATVGAIAEAQRSRHLRWSPANPPEVPSFPNVEGTGLFPRTSLVNHSCRPNASYEFLGTASLLLLAARNIAQDEEVTISYCDETADTAERATELQHWAFRCRCAACDPFPHTDVHPSPLR